MHHPTDWIAHTTTFVTPVMEHWLERDISFRIIGHVASAHFVCKYQCTLLMLFLPIIIIIIIISLSHSDIHKKDHGSSIFTCPAHIIDVHQDRIPSTAILENV